MVVQKIALLWSAASLVYVWFYKDSGPLGRNFAHFCMVSTKMATLRGAASLVCTCFYNDGGLRAAASLSAVITEGAALRAAIFVAQSAHVGYPRSSGPVSI